MLFDHGLQVRLPSLPRPIRTSTGKNKTTTDSALPSGNQPHLQKKAPNLGLKLYHTHLISISLDKLSGRLPTPEGLERTCLSLRVAVATNLREKGLTIWL
jgi:hypothetical protein